MAIPINGRQVGFVPDVGIIGPPVDYVGESIAALTTMSAIGQKRTFRIIR